MATELSPFEIPDIPEHYRRCPVLQGLKEHLWDLEGRKRFVQGSAEHFMADPKLQSRETYEKLFGEELDEEDVNHVNRGVGEMFSTTLDALDEAVDGVAEEMGTYTGSCLGVLAMRAHKGDSTYTVRICTSNEAYESESGNPTIAHVDVEPDL